MACVCVMSDDGSTPVPLAERELQIVRDHELAECLAALEQAPRGVPHWASVPAGPPPSTSESFV